MGRPRHSWFPAMPRFTWLMTIVAETPRPQLGFGMRSSVHSPTPSMLFAKAIPQYLDQFLLPRTGDFASLYREAGNLSSKIPQFSHRQHLDRSEEHTSELQSRG